MLSRIKKGDLVQVMSGKDKGKKGQVIELDLKSSKARVQGIAIQTKHVKPRSSGVKGTIEKREALVFLCKLMPVCPTTGKPSRIRIGLEDGKKVRLSQRSGLKI